jgi:tripartite-type tricarboxylate transporter receptor subunit TctC
MQSTKRAAIRLMTTLVAGLALATSAVAQSYPNKPITLLVPFPAGGFSDMVARLIGPPMSKVMNQPVLVENLGGASGAIAAQKMLSLPSDGYVVFLGGVNELILPPLVNAAVKYKSEDFRLVHLNTIANMSIIMRKDIPANNADEFLDYARKMAKEGKPVTYASVGIGSFYHLLGEKLSQETGIPMTHVPYKGGAPANQDLIGGQVDIFITPFGKMYEDLSKQGRVKVLAMLNSERNANLKDYPAIGESRALKKFTYTIWGGFFVKKDTPEPVVQALHNAFASVLQEPAVRAGLEAQSMVVPQTQSIAATDKLYADGISEFSAIAKSINLQPQ